MSDYTHADLRAAINGAWVATDLTCHDRGHPPGCCCSLMAEDHLDTLRAVLDLHQPTPVQSVCPWCVGYDSYNVDWPCPTVQIVADALRKMGAFDE